MASISQNFAVIDQRNVCDCSGLQLCARTRLFLLAFSILFNLFCLCIVPMFFQILFVRQISGRRARGEYFFFTDFGITARFSVPAMFFAVLPRATEDIFDGFALLELYSKMLQCSRIHSIRPLRNAENIVFHFFEERYI